MKVELCFLCLSSSVACDLRLEKIGMAGVYRGIFLASIHTEIFYDWKSVAQSSS